MAIQKDWFMEFDRRIKQIRQEDKLQNISMTDRKASLYGLSGYSEEMTLTHGTEEEERQKEIQHITQRMDMGYLNEIPGIIDRELLAETGNFLSLF